MLYDGDGRKIRNIQKTKQRKKFPVCSGSFENVINKMYSGIIYLINMYKKDLVLNNL